MELVEYAVDEYVEQGGKMRDFESGNGMWWQNSYYFRDGYGFGYKEDFTSYANEGWYIILYPSNLIFNI